VFRIEAIRAVVGVAGAADFLAAVSTGEIFGDFDKSHFGDRIAQVEKLIKRDDPEGWNRGADSNQVRRQNRKKTAAYVAIIG